MMAAHQRPESRALRLVALWTSAAICVAAAHGGIAWAVLNWPEPPIAASEPPAAVMIELAPIPLAPEAPPQDLRVGPQALISESSAPSETKDHPEPEKQSEPAKTSEPAPEQLPEVKAPSESAPLPDMASDAVLPPEKRSEAEKSVDEKPPEKPKSAEQSKPKSPPKKLALATSAPKPVPATRARTNAAPAAGISSSVSLPTWRGMLMAHLNRHKRPAEGGATGTASIQFTIDRSGRMLSIRLIGSSGNGGLDREALAWARRASPVPAPPADIKGAQITLTVPFRFTR